MRPPTLAGMAAAVCAVGSVAQAAPADIAGRWATQGFGSIVALEPCVGEADAWCGRIVWLWSPYDDRGRPRRDLRNPQAAQHLRPLVGVQIVEGLREVSPGTWSQGRIYNPDDGRTYTGKVVCQTQVWRRPQDLLAAMESR